MIGFTKERIEQFIKNPLEHGLTRSEQMEMARQLLAGLEQEPVAWTSQRSLDVRDKITAFTSKDSAEEYGEKSKWEEIVPLYAAPQLPQPSVVDEWRMMCGEWRDETVSIHDDSGLIVSGISPNAAGIIIEAHNARRAAIRNLGPIDAGKIQAERDALNEPTCWCLTCRPVTVTDMRFVVCPHCGNKRCPHANDHRNACTGSNEPGQEGSAYPAAPQQEVK